MGKSLIYAIILVSLLLPFVFAAPSYTFKKDEPTDLKISCFDIDNDLCNTEVDCYMTIHYPDLTNLYSEVTLVQSTNLDYFNYTLNDLTQTGEYPTVVRCVGNTTGFSTFTFEVTPTGKTQTSIFDNPMLLVLGIFAIVLIGMGVYFNSAGFGFIGAVMFLLGGIYTMIYGFNNVTDMYTRGIAVTFLGLGFIFIILSAYEWIWGSHE